MKKIFKNNRLIAIAFLTVFTTGLSSAAIAGDKNPPVPVQLKFAGMIQQQPLFQLSFYGNETQNEFTITIKDEYGNSLYRENFKGEVFSKKFLLNTDEIEDNTLLFEVYCAKTKQLVTYEVNPNTRFVQDIAIIEMK
jgi:hypothetical protein